MAGHIEDKPKDCHYCYFWKKAAGCIYRGKSGCYYQPEAKPEPSECDGCPYGNATPCIGWCTKELLRSLGLPREREQK